MVDVNGNQPLFQAETGQVDFDQPLLWATATLTKFDAIVCLMDSHNPRHCDPDWLGTLLRRYREKVRNSGVKWLACTVSTKTLTTASEEDPLTMDVAGFDEAVPQIIASFVRGDF